MRFAPGCARLGLIARSLLARMPFLLTTAALIAATPPFDPEPWLQDFDQAREAFGLKYANFDWAVFHRQADLSKLFDDARTRIAAARNDEDAKAAFDRLARQLGDGHVKFRWRSDTKAEAKAAPAADTCTALGYDARQAGRPLASQIQGYRALSSAAVEFPAGIVSSGNDKVGVVRIGVFGPQGWPTLCQGALDALKMKPSESCDDACSDKVDAWASARLTEDFAATLAALKTAGATTLLVDITQNGGGSEWTEAAARMVTGAPLTSERLGFVRGEHWVKKWSELAEELRTMAKTANVADQGELLAFAKTAEANAGVAATPCSSEPYWKGQRPECSWLGDGSTGLINVATAAEVGSKPWAALLFSPAKFPYKEGVWRGPLIVVVDGETWSAAEEFAALLQDNHAAVIMGAPTGGAGCGHTDGGTPTTLTHSLAVLELPDCARIRANGDNEIAGIQPDVLVGLRRYDGVVRQAKLLQEKLPEAVRSAKSLAR
jgi:Peptidase family S41